MKNLKPVVIRLKGIPSKKKKKEKLNQSLHRWIKNVIHSQIPVSSLKKKKNVFKRFLKVSNLLIFPVLVYLSSNK